MSAGVQGSPRVALVTGGTDGIGRATAKRLLQEGWEVVITARSAAKAEATVAELQSATGSALCSYLIADLSLMKEVKGAAAAFRERHHRLDLLLLNANAISQERALTPEGFESNMAIGYFGRVLLLWGLEEVLSTTPGAQVLSVVGLNLDRLDFDDPTLSKGFSSMKALGKWQWAMQVLTREHNLRGKTPMNTFMPGLVKTKILANEPQPMRAIVKLANLVMGIPVEKSAREVVSVVNEITRSVGPLAPGGGPHAGHKDAYFARTKLKPPRDLKSQPGDGEALWAMTERALGPYL